MEKSRLKHDLAEKVLTIATAQRLFRRGDKIIVGFSGGPDSTAVLAIMIELAPLLGLSVRAAHLNYGKRGVESGADNRYAVAFCRRFKISLDVFKVKSSDIKEAGGKGFQDAARKIRFDYFKELCEKHKTNKVVLGHTADDQIESFLLHLTRGTGAAGAAGMSYKRTVGRIMVLRPLLCHRKIEIINYLDSRKLRYRIDSSNLGIDYARNRVRNRLLPLLRKEYNPRIDEAILRHSKLLREENELLERLTGETLRSAMRGRALDRETLKNSPPALARRLFRAFAWKFESGIEIRFDQVEAVRRLAKSGGNRWSLSLHGKVSVDCQADQISLNKSAGKPALNRVEVFISGPGMIALPGGELLSISEGLLSGKEVKRYAANTRVEFVDATKVIWPMMIRLRKPGDRFRPLGGGSKKLKDFYIDEKLTSEEKKHQLLLLSNEHIVWVIGRRLGNDFSLSRSSKRVFRLELKNN